MPSPCAPAAIKSPAKIAVLEPVPVRVAPLMESRQILSEFAAEADLEEPVSGNHRARVAVSLLVVGLLASGMAGIVYFATRAVDVNASALPAHPAWMSPTQSPEPPSIDVVQDLESPVSLARIGRQGERWQLRDSGRIVREPCARRSPRQRARPARGFARAWWSSTSDLRAVVVLQIRVDGYQTAAQAEGDLARIRELPGYEDAHLLPN